MKRSVNVMLIALLGAVLWTMVLPPEAEARFTRRTGFVTVAFDGQCEDLLANQIQSARREILIAIYSMTSQRLENLIVTAAQRGIRVRIKYDASQASNTGMQRVLSRFEEQSGIEVTEINMRGRFASMHHKFMVIDGLRVVTGSFNFTAMAASSNYENCVLIESPQIAQDFANVFESIVDR